MHKLIIDEDSEEFTFQQPEAIARIIITKLESDATAYNFVSWIVNAPFELYGGVTSLRYAPELAEEFFKQASPELLLELARTPSGRRIRRLMNSHAPLRPLSENSEDAIYLEDFPVGDDIPNHCMNAVLENLMYGCGVGTKTAVNELAEERRSAAVAEAEGAKAKKEAAKPLNSQNLNAAVDIGIARRIGESVLNHEVCRKSIIHSKSKKPNDPFSFKRGTALNTLFEPNPEAMMLDALAKAPEGTYLFQASVAKHHAISLLLEKNREGKLTPGGGGYTIYWNDQYTDEEGYGTMVGAGLALDIFEATAVDASDPRRPTFWSGSMTEKDKEDAGGAEILSEAIKKKRVEEYTAGADGIWKRSGYQRCSNTHGIEIWLITGTGRRPIPPTLT